MAKRWTEAELRFIKDNAEKMSVQALADVLSVRIDELERKMEKLGLLGGTEAPAAKKAQTLKELSRHTENARKDFDRGVAALQKKKFDEAERNFLDLIQKYPDEKELVDRARVYLAVCERQKSDARPVDRARGSLLRGSARKEPGQRRRGDRALEARGQEERRRRVDFSPGVLLRAERPDRYFARASEEGDRGRPAPPDPGAPRPRFRPCSGDTGLPGAAGLLAKTPSAPRILPSWERGAARLGERGRLIRFAWSSSPRARAPGCGRRFRRSCTASRSARFSTPCWTRRPVSAGETVVVVGRRTGPRSRGAVWPPARPVVGGRSPPARATRPRRAFGAVRRREGPVLVLSGDVPLLLEARNAVRPVVERRAGGARPRFSFLSSARAGRLRPRRAGREAGRVRRIVEAKNAGQREAKIRRGQRAGVYCFAARRSLARSANLSARTRRSGGVLPDRSPSGPGGRDGREAVEADETGARPGAINTRRDLAGAEEIERRRAIERALDAGATIVDPATTRIGALVEVEPGRRDSTRSSASKATRRSREGCEVFSFTRVADSVLEAGRRRVPALRRRRRRDRRALARRAFRAPAARHRARGGRARRQLRRDEAGGPAARGQGAPPLLPGRRRDRRRRQHRRRRHHLQLRRREEAPDGDRARAPSSAAIRQLVAPVTVGAGRLRRRGLDDHEGRARRRPRADPGSAENNDGLGREAPYSRPKLPKLDTFKFPEALMCGIVGYVGPQEAAPLLLEGLKRLEYRGYDSAGIATLSNGTFTVLRSSGKLENLIAKVGGTSPPGTTGIGHTRWATHGRPTEENAHPHTDCTGRIVVVHNGIFENFAERKAALAAAGHRFTSETDTEVFAHEVEAAFDGDLFEAVRAAPGEAADGRLRGRRLFERGARRSRRGPLGSADRPRPRRRRELGRLRSGRARALDARRRLPRGRRRGARGRRGCAHLRRGRPALERRPQHRHPLGRGRGGEGRLPPLHAEGDPRAADGDRRDPRREDRARHGRAASREPALSARPSRRLRPRPSPRLRDLLALGADREVPDRGDGAVCRSRWTTEASSATAGPSWTSGR